MHKKGDKMVTGNYRPVSLTLQKKLVRDKIVMFVEKILVVEQHGFHIGRSCFTNLLVTLEEWTKLHDDGIAFDFLYPDVRKAFVSVLHARLF